MPDYLAFRASKLFKGIGIAIAENVIFHDKDGITRGFEERTVTGLTLPKRLFLMLAIGYILYRAVTAYHPAPVTIPLRAGGITNPPYSPLPGHDTVLHDRGPAGQNCFELPAGDGQVLPTKEIKAQLGSDAVVFTMGSANQKLEFDGNQTIFTKVDITMPSNPPVSSIYYVEADGSLTNAGIDGQFNGQNIQSGGTVLAKQDGVPEDGYTTYTFGLLLDHMSTFAASTKAAKSSKSDTGGCFINSGLPCPLF